MTEFALALGNPLNMLTERDELTFESLLVTDMFSRCPFALGNHDLRMHNLILPTKIVCRRYGLYIAESSFIKTCENYDAISICQGLVHRDRKESFICLTAAELTLICVVSERPCIVRADGVWNLFYEP